MNACFIKIDRQKQEITFSNSEDQLLLLYYFINTTGENNITGNSKKWLPTKTEFDNTTEEK